MNKYRRKDLDAIVARHAALIARLGDLGTEFETLKNELESIRDEEQEYHDLMPESFQNGEKGEKSQASIDAIEEGIVLLETITDFCEASDSESGEFESQLSTAKGD